VLESHRRDQDARDARGRDGSRSEQQFYADLKKPREIEHDLQVYRAYLREAERLRERGHRVERVVLDYEMKRDYQRFLQERNRGRADSDGRPDRSKWEVRQWAHEHALQCDESHVRFPDARIEYVDQYGRHEHLDIEVVTIHYRGARRHGQRLGGLDLSRRQRTDRRVAVRSRLRVEGAAMTADERVRALGPFRFTDRQARFLATVMLHSGVCLPRQYCAFADIVYGEKTRRFFAKLIRRGFACDYPCRHNRGRIYHVRHKPLYAAVGAPESHLRRPMSAARVLENLAVLDALIGTPAVTWFSTADEANVELAGLRGTSADAFPSGMSERVIAFNRTARDSIRMAIDPTGRPVFLYVATEWPTDSFHREVQRLLTVVDGVPAWTLRIAMSKPCGVLQSRLEAALKDELAALLPVMQRRLTWYFKQRRAHELEHAHIEPEDEYDQAHEGFQALRFQALYHRWLEHGDAALGRIGSTAAADAITSGAARIEYHILPFSYRHLSPVVDAVAERRSGAEEGENTGSVSRPPEPNSGPDLIRNTNVGVGASARRSKLLARRVFAEARGVERRDEGRRSVPPDNDAAGTATRA
jgi:hypothetical protein